MATLIRDAVIRIGLQQIPTELKAPNVQPVVDGQKEITAAAVDTQKALAAAQEQHEKAAVAMEIANTRATQSFLKAGASAFQFARGVAFLAASSTDDLQKVLATLALFQGGFDILRGGANTVRHLSASLESAAASGGVAAFILANPLLAGVLAVSAALVAGIAYWKAYGESMEDVERRFEAVREARIRSNLAIEQITGIEAARDLLRNGNITGATAALGQLRQPKETLDDQINQERELIDLKRKQNQEALQAADVQEQMITRRQRELDVANNLFELERNKLLTIEAQLGLLSKGEQNELKRLAEKVAGGGQLTARESERFGQLGGDLTRESAQAQAANLGRTFAEEIAKILGKDFRGRQGELQAEAERAAAALQDATGGFGPQEMIQRLQEFKTDLERFMKNTVDAQAEYLRQMEQGFDKAARRAKEIENANF